MQSKDSFAATGRLLVIRLQKRLAAVFIVATGGLYGWAPAALAGAVTRGTIEVARRRPFERFAYNASVYALSGAAAGAASALAAQGAGVVRLLLQVLAGSTAFYV